MPHIIDSGIVEGIQRVNGRVTDMTITTVTASTLTLTSASTHIQTFLGTTAGQIVRMPNSTTIIQGHQFWIFNQTSVQLVVQLNDGSEPYTLTPGGSARMILRTPGTVAGVWQKAISSNSPFQGTAPVICGYGGQANTGRFLEYVSGNSSDVSPFTVISNSTIVGMSIGSTSSNTATVALYKNGDFNTIIASVSLTNQSNNFINTLNVPVATGDLITAKVSSGSLNKPFLAFYIAGS